MSKCRLYCCATNCSTHNKTVDPRTNKQVRLHSFPNPLLERNRCLKWIINLRRDDLNLMNIKYKRVCSQHFEPEAYNCPRNISESTLRTSAVPTIFRCKDHPKLTVTDKSHKRKLSTILPDIFEKSKEKHQILNTNSANSESETEAFFYY